MKTSRVPYRNPHFFLLRELFFGVSHGLGMVFFGGVATFALIYTFGTPNATNLLTHRFAETSVIYDRTGTQVLYRIYGEENRKIIPSSEIPEVMKYATVAAEDKDFFAHHGIDLSSILRAIQENIKNNSLSQGGSTITQQLARNVFLTREKSLRRKIIEAIIAIKIEREFDKNTILSFYLNTVPYGTNAYGIETASETYFGKRAKDLTLDEAALLAAIPKATTYYSPYGRQCDDLQANQRRILVRMRELGFASPEDVRIALAQNTLEKLVPNRIQITAPHFVFHVIEELEREYSREKLETGGLRIITTLDVNLQKVAEEAVRNGAARNDSRNAKNAALVALDPKTGEILAMVGSVNFFDANIDGQVNAAESLRSPGSSWKPIIYGRALEEGFEPYTWLLDAPMNFGKDGSGKPYIPRNYDGKFHGPVTVRQALQMSLNIPAIDTLSRIGLEDAKAYAKRLGITTVENDRPYGLSFAIGGLEVSLLEMVSAFSVYGNDGVRMTPHAILSLSTLSDNSSRVLGVSSERVVDAEIARKINSILSDNIARIPIFGPRSPLFFPDRSVAAKTGTSQEFRDAWTVGYTPSLAAGVWVGNNNGSFMKPGSDGIYVAAPIWHEFMENALSRNEREEFPSYQESIKEEKRYLLYSKEELEKTQKSSSDKRERKREKEKKKKK